MNINPCATIFRLKMPSLAIAVFLLSILVLIHVPLNTYAEIQTDGTVGPVRALSGPDYLIPQALGMTAGRNLFHSFERFGLSKGESATFTGADAIANVISRVTGGVASNIDGLFRSEIGQADFFFINPAGVVFGPNAQVDVPAAFHVSTSDELRFVDGGVFSAAAPEKSSLSVAEPASFGYLNSQPASVVLNGSRLTFAPGSEVSFDGGDVAIKGAEMQDAALVSEGGDIRLTAVGDRVGPIFMEGGMPGDAAGNVLIEAAGVDGSGSGGGRVGVKAGDVRISASRVSANNIGDVDDVEGGVDLMVDGPIRVDRGSRVESNAFGAGDSAGIDVRGQSLLIDQKVGEKVTGLFSEVEPGAEGNSGGIDISLDKEFRAQGVCAIISSTLGGGDSGNINVNADDFLFDGEGRKASYRGFDFKPGIANEAVFGSNGNAGDISIVVEDMFSISNAASLSTYTIGVGDAGAIGLSAGRIILDGGNVDLITGLVAGASDSSSGHGGSIGVHANELMKVKNNALISTYASGNQGVGETVVRVDGPLEILNGGAISSNIVSKGVAGDIAIHAEKLIMNGSGSNKTGILSYAYPEATGDSGNVDILVDDNMELIDGARIYSRTGAKSDAGNVTVRANELQVKGDGKAFTGIWSEAFFGSTGNSGKVEIKVNGSIDISNKATLSTSTYSEGVAGKITVHAGSLKIEGCDRAFTGIESQANPDSRGDAGTVTIDVNGPLELVDGATISADTFAEGDAGDVKVAANEVILCGGKNGAAEIKSDADLRSKGNAGTVEVKATNLLALINGAAISSATFSEGDAGGIVIRANDIKIEGSEDKISRINSGTYSGAGNGGIVDVFADNHIELERYAEITSKTAGDGKAGAVSVKTGQMRIDGPQAYISSSAGSNSQGDAGNINIEVETLLELMNGAMIFTSTISKGRAGNISIRAGDTKIDGGQMGYAYILSDARQGSEGDAGSVNLWVDGFLTLSNGAAISASTLAEGQAGDLLIQAGKLRMNDAASIGSVAGPGSHGDGGSVEVNVDESLELQDMANIASSSYAEGDAGKVTVHVGSLQSKGESGVFMGILSNAYSTGDAGPVKVTVDGLIELLDKGTISSSTYAQGDAGKVTVHSGELRMKGEGGASLGIWSDASVQSEGDAGTVTVTVDGLLEILDDGRISSSTVAEGDAGNVTVHAGNLKIEGNEGIFTGILSNASAGSKGNAGKIDVWVDERLELLNEGTISSSTFSEGNGGEVTIHAGELRIVGGEGGLIGIWSDASVDSQGNAGAVDVKVDGLLEILHEGRISSSTFAKGKAGEVAVRAGTLKIDGKGRGLPGIFSDASIYSKGDAGDVVVKVDDLIELMDDGEISSSTYSEGDAGGVIVEASELRLTGGNIECVASVNSKGKAGSVDVTVKDALSLSKGAKISSSTFGEGDAGRVIVLTGTFRAQSYKDLTTGILSDAMPGSKGNAHAVKLTVDGHLTLLDGAEISSTTYGKGDAGHVSVRSGDLTITGIEGDWTGIWSDAALDSKGNAGSVNVSVKGLLEMYNGATISSDAYAAGDAGSIIVNANNIKIEGNQNMTAIQSVTNRGADGNAGSVSITVGSLLELRDGAYISTTTLSKGNAGHIQIDAPEFRVNNKNSENLTGVFSHSSEEALGYVGSIVIDADVLHVENAGQINVSALNTLPDERITGVPDSSIVVNAKKLSLNQNSKITAESAANVPAASIQLHAGELIVGNNSHITTTSNNADGGPIRVEGDLIILSDGIMTTSVDGASGDGGNISVRGLSTGSPNMLIFQGGFIQANTAAKDARGGDIFIDVRTVIAESGLFEVGGAERQVFEPGSGLNVIQAAAPGGEQGNIAITAPNLDISGSLVNINADFGIPVRMATDPCRPAAMENPSTLVRCGSGGFPTGPQNPSMTSLKNLNIK